MRISGGAARGIPLQAGEAEGLRPATARLRQAVFSSLGELVTGCRFLDLFAGTGAYGLEAVSRGASGGIFIEKDKRMAAVIEKNLRAACKSMNLENPPCRIITADALVWRPAKEERFDLIFAGPPYRLIPEIEQALFSRAVEWLAGGPQARLLFEMPGAMTYEPEGWRLRRRVGKGRRQPTMAIYTRSNEAEC